MRSHCEVAVHGRGAAEALVGLVDEGRAGIAEQVQLRVEGHQVLQAIAVEVDGDRRYMEEESLVPEPCGGFVEERSVALVVERERHGLIGGAADEVEIAVAVVVDRRARADPTDAGRQLSQHLAGEHPGDLT